MNAISMSMTVPWWSPAVIITVVCYAWFFWPWRETDIFSGFFEFFIAFFISAVAWIVTLAWFIGSNQWLPVRG